jgi:hypothetical protein
MAMAKVRQPRMGRAKLGGAWPHRPGGIGPRTGGRVGHIGPTDEPPRCDAEEGRRRHAAQASVAALGSGAMRRRRGSFVNASAVYVVALRSCRHDVSAHVFRILCTAWREGGREGGRQLVIMSGLGGIAVSWPSFGPRRPSTWLVLSRYSDVFTHNVKPLALRQNNQRFLHLYMICVVH